MVARNGLAAAMVEIACSVPSGDGAVAAAHAERLAADVHRSADAVADLLAEGDGWRGRAAAVRNEVAHMAGARRLHRLLDDVSGVVEIGAHVVAVCEAAAACARDDAGLRVVLSVPAAVVDAAVARWVGAIVAALLCGGSGGAPVATGAPVEIGVSLGAWTIHVEIRDLGDDPPDRLAVGGDLLARLVEVTRAVAVGRPVPGHLELCMPHAGLASVGCAGRA